MRALFVSFLMVAAVFSAAAQEVLQERVVLYLFKPEYRSFINDKVELMAYRAVKDNFADEIENGRLEIKEIDISLPENETFIKKYDLNSGNVSAVIVTMHNFKVVRYYKYDKIWHYARRQEPDFKKYIIRTTRNFLNQQNIYNKKI